MTGKSIQRSQRRRKKENDHFDILPIICVCLFTKPFDNVVFFPFLKNKFDIHIFLYKQIITPNSNER